MSAMCMHAISTTYQWRMLCFSIAVCMSGVHAFTTVNVRLRRPNARLCTLLPGSRSDKENPYTSTPPGQYMSVSREVVQHVRDTVTLSSVVEQYTELSKSGSSGYMARCPFHDDKNPSMGVTDSKGLYHCFSCGASGDVIKFVMDIERCSFVDAIVRIGGMTEMSFDLNDISADTLANSAHRRRADTIKRVLRQASAFYSDVLIRDARAGGARAHMIQRKIQPKTAFSFGLGFSPSDSALVQNLTALGFTMDELMDAGMLNNNSAENATDRFRGRLMIPIRDRQGGVVGFGGRVLYEHSSGPKYLNSPETIVFKKSNILFGLDQAAAAIRSTAFVVIVEGYFDAISLHNIGVTNAVAAMGTTLTPAQIEIAARSLSKVVYILMDADSAGQKAARSICSNVLPAVRDESIMVKIAQLPEGFKDSADFALKHTAEEFRTKVLDVASPWTEWYTDLILRDYNATDVNSFSHCVAEITNFLVKLDNPADRTFLIYRFASRIAGDRKGFALQLENNLVEILKQKESKRRGPKFGAKELDLDEEVEMSIDPGLKAELGLIDDDNSTYVNPRKVLEEPLPQSPTIIESTLRDRNTHFTSNVVIEKLPNRKLLGTRLEVTVAPMSQISHPQQVSELSAAAEGIFGRALGKARRGSAVESSIADTTVVRKGYWERTPAPDASGEAAVIVKIRWAEMRIMQLLVHFPAARGNVLSAVEMSNVRFTSLAHRTIFNELRGALQRNISSDAASLQQQLRQHEYAGKDLLWNLTVAMLFDLSPHVPVANIDFDVQAALSELKNGQAGYDYFGTMQQFEVLLQGGLGMETPEPTAAPQATEVTEGDLKIPDVPSVNQNPARPLLPQSMVNEVAGFVTGVGKVRNDFSHQRKRAEEVNLRILDLREEEELVQRQFNPLQALQSFLNSSDDDWDFSEGEEDNKPQQQITAPDSHSASDAKKRRVAPSRSATNVVIAQGKHDLLDHIHRNLPDEVFEYDRYQTVETVLPQAATIPQRTKDVRMSSEKNELRGQDKEARGAGTTRTNKASNETKIVFEDHELEDIILDQS